MAIPFTIVVFTDEGSHSATETSELFFASDLAGATPKKKHCGIIVISMTHPVRMQNKHLIIL